MTTRKRLLIAGESWSTTSVHTKGFDSFHTSTYEEGAWPFIGALRAAGWEVEYLPNHVAAERFPSTVEELDRFDVVVLSDIGANTLLLPSSVFVKGNQASANRLKVLAGWVRGGGALLMVGGYLSFQGIEGKANYRNTPLRSVLPVDMELGDDREETPEGAIPTVGAPHAVTRELTGEWPAILGYQRTVARSGAQVLATVNDHPLIVIDVEGRGRVAAVTTDMGPHWLPKEFLEWPGYSLLWQRLADWLAGSESEAEG